MYKCVNVCCLEITLTGKNFFYFLPAFREMFIINIKMKQRCYFSLHNAGSDGTPLKQLYNAKSVHCMEVRTMHVKSYTVAYTLKLVPQAVHKLT